VLEYSTSDGDHPADAHDWDAGPGRPDEWVAPGGPPVSAAAGPESLSLSYSVTVNDVMAIVLDHPATRKRFEAELAKAAWLRSWWLLLLTLGLSLLTDLYMFDLGVTWSVLSTVVLGGLFALVRWSQIDHFIKRSLPAAVEREALHALARTGDQRRITADAGGLTLADAATSGRVAWAQVRLSETERHVLLTVGSATWAIPKALGEPLATFVQFARGHGAR
jgi:hypothetical protein